MRTLKLCTATVLLLATALPAQAETFDAAIGEDTVRIGLSGPLGRLLAVDKGEYDLGVIGGDIEDDTDERFLAAHAGAMLTGDAGGSADTSFVGGLGARLQYLNADHENGGSLALGGQLRLKLLQANRLRFNAFAWYGPDASTFGDFEEYIEYGASVGFEVLRDAELYVGYRAIEVEFDGGVEADLVDGAHVGIRLEF